MRKTKFETWHIAMACILCDLSTSGQNLSVIFKQVGDWSGGLVYADINQGPSTSTISRGSDASDLRLLHLCAYPIPTEVKIVFKTSWVFCQISQPTESGCGGTHPVVLPLGGVKVGILVSGQDGL